MPIIVLTTAAGAPGASTTALGFALCWPGPSLLVEADPAGTSLVPGWFRGGIDPHERNIVNLALVDRAEELTEAILDQAITLQSDDQHERLALLGLTEPVQAPALEAWWGPIGAAFQTLSAAGYAVIVDAGRLTQGSYPTPLLAVADQVLLVCRATLASILRTYPMAAQLDSALTVSGNADGLGIVAIGNDGHRYYPAATIAKHLGARFAIALPDDPLDAAALSDGMPLPPRLTARVKSRLTRLCPTTNDDGIPETTNTPPGADHPPVEASTEFADGSTPSARTTPAEEPIEPAAVSTQPDNTPIVVPAKLMRSYRAAARDSSQRAEARLTRLLADNP